MGVSFSPCCSQPSIGAHGQELSLLEGLQHRYDKLLDLRESAGLPKGRVSTHDLAQLLKRAPQIAPMHVLPCSDLLSALESKSIQKIDFNSTVHVSKMPENGRIILLSHRWWSSVRGHPDKTEHNWPKVREVLEKVVPSYVQQWSCDIRDIYLWWDFFSICQFDDDLKLKQIGCIPVFVSMADGICACRSGDEDFHADGGAKVFDWKTKSTKEYEGPLHKHPGHYNNRVWTMCELFMATSTFQTTFRGAEMAVYSAEFDKDFKLTSKPVDQTRILRSQFHEMHAWSMPPAENLVDRKDLLMLEPLVVILADRSVPRLVRAAMFGLHEALEAFLEANDDVNAKDPHSGEAAIHFAAKNHDEKMLLALLDKGNILVNVQNREGQTPLHLLIAFSAFDHRYDPDRQERCVKVLLEHGADPRVKDNIGRSVNAMTMSRLGVEKAVDLFPDHQDMLLSSPSLAVERFHREGKNLAKVTHHIKDFEGGNKIAWRRLVPSDENDVQPGLVVSFSSGLASGGMLMEWGTRITAKSGMEVILVDLPGNGKSEWHLNGKETPQEAIEDISQCPTTEEMMAMYCKDIIQLFQDEGWATRRCHMSGTSFGSMVALYLALRFPEWCHSLTAIAWLHSTRHTPDLAAGLKGMGESFIKIFESGDVAKWDEAAGAFMSPDADDNMKELFFAACRPGGDHYAGNRAMNCLSFLMYAHVKNVLSIASLTVPALVVQGEADAMFIDHALQWQRLMPHSKLAIIPFVCHLPPVENPKNTAAVFLDFVHSTTPPAESSP